MPFKKVVLPGIVKWWYGRGNSGDSWLSEEKKANMWYGRRNSGSSWPPAFPRSLEPQDFGFLDPDPQKNANPRIQI